MVWLNYTANTRYLERARKTNNIKYLTNINQGKRVSDRDSGEFELTEEECE